MGQGDYICTLFSPLPSLLHPPHYPLSLSTHPFILYSVILPPASSLSFPFLGSFSLPVSSALSLPPSSLFALFGALPRSCHR